MQSQLLIFLVDFDGAPGSANAQENVGFILELEQQHVVKVCSPVLADKHKVAGKGVDGTPFGQLEFGKYRGSEPEPEAVVCDPAPGADFEIHRGAHGAQYQAQHQTGMMSERRLTPLARAAVSS